jgi:hypothetical protein
MSNNKQSSSIDFFWNQLPEILPFTVDTETAVKLWGAFEQAKAMEKKQCVDFALKCMLNGLEPHQSTREVIEKLFDEGLQ